jgi:uncharacterized membrane protein YagU involved in acid resistance
MDTKAAVVSGIVGGITIYVLGTIMLYVIAPGVTFNTEMVTIGLTMHIVFGLIFGFIYSTIKGAIPGAGWKQGAIYGLIIWLIGPTATLTSLYTLLIMLATNTWGVTAQTATGLVVWLIIAVVTGIAIALTHKVLE